MRMRGWLLPAGVAARELPEAGGAALTDAQGRSRLSRDLWGMRVRARA